MICSKCGIENPENIQYCENCGEELIKDDFTQYGKPLFYLGLIIYSFWAMSGDALNHNPLSVYFGYIGIIGGLMFMLGATFMAYRWFTPKKYGN